jgi:hypothetical protein
MPGSQLSPRAAAGLIDDGQAGQLRHFYLNPRDHAWNA